MRLCDSNKRRDSFRSHDLFERVSSSRKAKHALDSCILRLSVNAQLVNHQTHRLARARHRCRCSLVATRRQLVQRRYRGGFRLSAALRRQRDKLWYAC